MSILSSIQKYGLGAFSYHVLITDDEPLIVEMTQKEFQLAGYAVFPAFDGETALQTYRDVRPDLVILYVKMPGLTGLQCLQLIRQTAPDLPVIIMTAYANVPNAVEAMKHGGRAGRPWAVGTCRIGRQRRLRDSKQHPTSRQASRASLNEEVDTLCRRFTASETLTAELTHAFIKAIYIHGTDRIEIEWCFKDVFYKHEGETVNF